MMRETENGDPYSPPRSADEHPTRLPEPTAKLSGGDWAKIVVSIVILLCILPCIPFGVIGKAAYAFGTSFAIFNYWQRLKNSKSVTRCPECQRIIAQSTSICPRCNHRFN